MSNDNSNNGQALQRTAPDGIKGLQVFLKTREKALADYARNSVKPETLIRLALFEFSKNKDLRECTPESIYGCLVLAAQLGLEISGIRGEAYLTAFRGKCTLIPGYRGLIMLALRSRAVKSFYSHPVYESDFFDIQLGTEPRIDHKPDLNRESDDIKAAYAVARLTTGDVDVEPMGRRDLEKLVQWVKSKRGGKLQDTYRDWESEMIRKAPLRRLSKRLPLGEDFFRAAKLDELADEGVGGDEALKVLESEAEVIDEQPQQANGTRSRVAQARQEADAQ